MNNRPVRLRTLHGAAAISIVICLLFLFSPVTGQTPEGPVPVPCCPENGQRCTGGADCIDGICHKECGNNPFTQDCECTVAEPGGDGAVVILVVIGVISAIAVGGALVVAKGRRKETSGTRGEDKTQPSVYILQLSTDRLTISPGNPGRLVATVWKKDAGGILNPAPAAGIAIRAPPSAPWLVVAPAAGKGTLESTFSVAQDASGGFATGTIPVPVVATAEGTSVTANLSVEITGAYTMETY